MTSYPSPYSNPVPDDPMADTHPMPAYTPGVNPWILRLPILSISGGMMLGILLVGAVFFFQFTVRGKMLAGVSAAGVPLGGMTPTEAVAMLQNRFAYDDDSTFTFRYAGDDGEQFWQMTAGELGVRFDAEATAAEAYAVGHSGRLIEDVVDQALTWLNGYDASPLFRYDQAQAANAFAAMARAIDRPAQNAAFSLSGTQISMTPPVYGRALDVAPTLARLDEAILSLAPGGEIPLVVRDSAPLAVDSSAAAARAQSAISAPITLIVPEASGATGQWTIGTEQIAALLSVETVQDGNGSYRYDVSASAEPFREALESLAAGLVVPAQNGRFDFDETTGALNVTQNGVSGRALNVDSTLAQIEEAIFNPSARTIPLMFDYDNADYYDGITAAELGITELVSQGRSSFAGSGEARRQNIVQAASRFDGIIIAPGQMFSFNEWVGDISPEAGYAEGFVIFGGRTIPGVGGGVCQVSTTAFRAAFYGGFPIAERWAHGYRVAYYEDSSEGVGMDAAIYTPDLDFKFVNDTLYHLLIETEVDTSTSTVIFNFYSTNPGRTVVRGERVVRDVQPANPTRYMVNPDLAYPNRVQTDWAAEGAYVAITRIITDMNGTEISREIIASQYQAWGAVVEVAPGDPAAT